MLLTDNLKKKTLLAYYIISLLFVSILFLALFLVYTEEASAQQINITGKQRMLSQRLVLLCNNYYNNPSDKNAKQQIENSLTLFISNHNYIKNIKNRSIDEILYELPYQYDNLVLTYKNSILQFLADENLQHLKVINNTNEPLLTIANNIVELLTVEFKKSINFFITIILILSILFLLILYFVYKKIILKSILNTQSIFNELEDDKRFIKSILYNSSHAIITTKTDGTITLFNKQAESLLGYKSEELVGKSTPAVFHKESEVIEKAEQLSKEFNVDIKPGFDVFVEKSKRGLNNCDEWIYITKDNRELNVKLSISALKDKEGNVNGYLGIAEDITDFKIKDREIKDYLELIDKNIITSTTDLSGKITYTSEAFSIISGYSKEELVGKNHRVVKHEDMDPKVYKELWESISQDIPWCGEIKNRTKDGGFYWVEATIVPIFDYFGKKIGYTAIRQDISNKKMIEQLSITDGLTNLYNRRHFNDIAQNEIDKAKRDKTIFGFVLLDIDNFKKYNDTYGHQNGDNVLIDVSKALKESFKRTQDIVFRLGGEEFGAIISSNSLEEIEKLVENSRENIESLAIEHKLNTPSKVITASYGVAVVYTNDHTKEYDIDVIYKYVDELLYEAKESGRNRVVVGEME